MSDEEWPLEDDDLETFLNLDDPTRKLVLRMLSDPTDEDHAELAAHPQGKVLASWLLTLPFYRRGHWSKHPEDEDDSDLS